MDSNGTLNISKVVTKGKPTENTGFAWMEIKPQFQRAA